MINQKSAFSLLFIILLMSAICSCSDARRMQRIENRHPDWVKSDSTKHNYASPPVYIHDTSLKEIPVKYTPPINIDSLVNSKADSLGWIRAVDCKAIANKAYADKGFLFPTNPIDLNGKNYSGTLSFIDGKPVIDLTVKPDSIPVVTEIKTLNPPVPIAWWQYLFMWIGGLALLSFLSLLIFAYIKKAFPWQMVK